MENHFASHDKGKHSLLILFRGIQEHADTHTTAPPSYINVTIRPFLSCITLTHQIVRRCQRHPIPSSNVKQAFGFTDSDAWMTCDPTRGLSGCPIPALHNIDLR